MRNRALRLALPAVALLILGSVAVAAQQGPGRFADAEHRYNVDTVDTVTGTVDEVLLRTGRAGAAGLHLLVTAGDEQIEVMVGPTFYVYPEGLEVEAGDEVTVTGSRFSVDGRSSLMAREIHVGDFSLTLRDESGLPAWRGQGPESRARGEGDEARAAGRGCGRMARGGGSGHHGGHGGHGCWGDGCSGCGAAGSDGCRGHGSAGGCGSGR